MFVKGFGCIYLDVYLADFGSMYVNIVFSFQDGKSIVQNISPSQPTLVGPVARPSHGTQVRRSTTLPKMVAWTIKNPIVEMRIH